MISKLETIGIQEHGVTEEYIRGAGDELLRLFKAISTNWLMMRTGLPQFLPLTAFQKMIFVRVQPALWSACSDQYSDPIEL